MLGPGFSVTGKGMLLNLRNKTWKYLLVAKADETRVTQGGETFNLGGHEVPIRCRGKLVDKNCKPDILSIAKTIGKKAILDKVIPEDSPVKNLLDKFLKF